MYTRKDTLNSREYADSLKIAQAALNTIEIIKQCANHSIQKHGYYHIERPDMEYILFDIPQLRKICFDYAFAALENFLEHIGFILFYDWDGQEKQKHYAQKQEKLLLLSEVIEKTHQPNLDYMALEMKWQTILQSINPKNHISKRNPIKHTHSEIHDIKMQRVSSNGTMMNSIEYEQLVNGTCLALTDEECIKITLEVEEFINSIHSYMQENKLIFRVYCDCDIDQKIEKRKDLLAIFLVNPFAPPIYSSGLTLQKPSILHS